MRTFLYIYDFSLGPAPFKWMCVLYLMFPIDSGHIYSIVDTLVCLQVTGTRETLSTLFTAERFFSCVDTLVSLQVA